MKVRPVAHYRIWLYAVNGCLLVIQLFFLLWSFAVLTDPLMALFPINFSDIPVVTMYVSITVQFIACFLGLFGVACSSRRVIRAYWLLMIPIVIFDTLQMITWALSFRHVHSQYALFLESVAERELLETVGDTSLPCAKWTEVHDAFKCCPPMVAQRHCGRAGLRFCNADGTSNCAIPLLRWLHGEADLLGTLLYFVLYPIKLVVIVMLRQDILELFSEIVYSDNRLLYRHWASAESDDDETEVSTTIHSHEHARSTSTGDCPSPASTKPSPSTDEVHTVEEGLYTTSSSSPSSLLSSNAA